MKLTRNSLKLILSCFFGKIIHQMISNDMDQIIKSFFFKYSNPQNATGGEKLYSNQTFIFILQLSQTLFLCLYQAEKFTFITR